MYRLWLLSVGQLSWKASFQTVMLWEFATAVAPGFIGGAAPALYLVHKEGINVGKSTAIVLTSSFLDEMFFILLTPIMVLVFGWERLLPELSIAGNHDIVRVFLGLGYLYMMILAFIILYGIFFNPHSIRTLLVKIFGLPFIRRWRYAALRTGDELTITAQVMRRMPIKFWLKLAFATSLIWSSRLLLVNALVLMVYPIQGNFLLLGRQIAMWVILLISPTPGSSGAAEMLFVDFVSGFVGAGISLGGLALLWRILSFYIYLVTGAIILPLWVRRVFGSKG